MNEQLDKLGTVVAKGYAGTGENPTPELALVLSSCDAPTYGLLDSAGNRYHWRQDLTRPANAEEIARYWRERADAAESLQGKLYALIEQLQTQNSKLIERLNSSESDLIG